MAIKNYYLLLKIDHDSDLETIKKAFRKEIALYHPHNNKSLEAEAVFEELVEAFDILSDPIKRETYDKLLEESQSSKPILLAPEKEKTYRNWQKQSKKKSKTYRSSPLEELLMLDIFLTAGTGVLDGLLTETDSLIDGLSDSLSDVFDLF